LAGAAAVFWAEVVLKILVEGAAGTLVAGFLVTGSLAYLVEVICDASGGASSGGGVPVPGTGAPGTPDNYTVLITIIDIMKDYHLKTH
jgi:hypothetical protein